MTAFMEAGDVKHTKTVDRYLLSAYNVLIVLTKSFTLTASFNC